MNIRISMFFSCLLLSCSSPPTNSDAAHDVTVDAGQPNDNNDTSHDVGDERTLPENCFLYSDYEQTCEMAGCNLFQAGNRVCLAESGDCVQQVDYHVCGFVVEEEYGFSGLNVPYFVQRPSGDFIVAWMPIVDGTLRDWQTCRTDGEGGALRVGAPPECQCTLGDLIPGECVD